MSGTGLRLGGKAPKEVRSWEALVQKFGSILPPYPGVDVIPVARVPHPPLITEEMSKTKALRVTARGYRAALEREYGPSRILVEATYKDPKAVLESKHAHDLVLALPVLIKYQIAPAAWTAFSIYVWKTYVMKGEGALHQIPSKIRRPRRGTPPAPKWVFSLKRLEERTEWFSWHESFCRGGQLCLAKPHRELMERHRRLRATLFASYDDLTDAAVRELVATYLPHATFERLKREAQAFAEFEQDRLDQAALDGEWLRQWSGE